MRVIAAIAISPVFIVALDPSLKLISAFYQIHFDQVHVLDYQQEQLLIFQILFISLKKLSLVDALDQKVMPLL